MNRQYFCAFATAGVFLAVSAFAFAAVDFGAASESTAISAADLEMLATSPVAVVPGRGEIDLDSWQPTAFRDNLRELFEFVLQLYEDYPGQSFLFFRFLFHKTPFAG